MQENLVYLTYWQRKKLFKSGSPKFPLFRWWNLPELCEVEEVIFSLDLGKRYMITRIFGLDYADNIILIAYKPNFTQ